MDVSETTLAARRAAPTDDGDEATRSRESTNGAGEPTRPPTADRLGRGWVGLALAVVALPPLVATVRVLLRGWAPLADNGLIAIRANDVATAHHPLLGLSTSASLELGVPVNHPGPLYFDLLALPVRLLGIPVGTPVGAMLVNLAAAGFAVLAAGRLAGRLAMLSMAAATAALQWSMGSEMLFDPWQPNAMVLPMLAFATACWGLAAGRPWFLPFVVGLGSLVLQTHVGYVYLVPIAALAAGGLATARLWRDPARRLATLRALAISVVVAVLAWLQPLIEQLGGGGGNLSNLARAAGQSGDPLGPRLATRVVAQVLTVPPFWLRPSYDDAVPVADLTVSGDAVEIVSLPVAAVGLLALVGLLVVAGQVNRAAGRDALATATTVALILVGGAFVSVVLMPQVLDDLLSPHPMRWLWSIGAFIGAVLLATVTTAASLATSAARVRVAAVATAALAVSLALAALPTHVNEAGPTVTRDSFAASRELVAGLDPLENRGTLLFDVSASSFVFGEPHSGAVYAALADRGIPFFFQEEGMIRQLGERRRFEGEADVRIWMLTGGAVVPPDELPSDVEQIVALEGITPDEEVELERLERELRREAADGLPLTESGQRAARGGRLSPSALEPPGERHPFDTIGDLRLAVREGWLDLPPEREKDYQRFVELRRRFANDRVALYAAPMDHEPSP